MLRRLRFPKSFRLFPVVRRIETSAVQIHLEAASEWKTGSHWTCVASFWPYIHPHNGGLNEKTPVYCGSVCVRFNPCCSLGSEAGSTAEVQSRKMLRDCKSRQERLRIHR